MLKFTLLASALALAAPAVAQDQATPQTPPVQSEPGRTTMPSEATTESENSPPIDSTVTVADAADATASAAPAQSAAADAAGEATMTAEASSADEVATTAEAKPVPTNQIADVVNTEFPTYDKDANGDLSTTEFGSWMVALRTASDPATKAESAEIKTWIGQAFASADADKSKAVSKTELTAFLSKPQS